MIPDRPGEATGFRADGWRGERDVGASEALVRAAIAAHEEGGQRVLKQDARSRVTSCRAEGVDVVVKEVRKAGLRRRLADAVRGAPARRAFRAARRLIAGGVGAARPLAAVERRHLGLPVRSLLLSEDLARDPTAARLLAGGGAGRETALDALADLLLALHRAGAWHGDLRAQHVHLRVSGDSVQARLIDLESVRFGPRADDDARLEDWAQIGGSIPDADASLAERRAAFARYAREMPFRIGLEPAFEQMTRRSIARRHLYRGR